MDDEDQWLRSANTRSKPGCAVVGRRPWLRPIASDDIGLANGDYALEARTNASAIFKEDTYGDNTTWVDFAFRARTSPRFLCPVTGRTVCRSIPGA